jgi:thiosulfate/3-mercaptopyruvate sulfurtransferase
LLKSPEELAAYFGSKGISNTSKIVIYDDGSSKYNSRVYWVLKYLGATDVHILHKDMDQWKAARIPLTRAPSKPAKATFTPSVNKKLLATTSQVKAKLGDAGTVLLDGRTEAEYNGTSTEKKSNGHIKGAKFLEYNQFLDDKGAYKSKEEIEAIAKKHGITADKTVITYCATGVKAAVLYTALAEIAGYTNVVLYDGSYNEWAADTSNPLEK